jgi:hypothetical protein
MFLLNFTLTYLACISLGITVAAFDELLNIQNFKFFGKRQGDAYRSTTTQCGIGATCEASCGPGYTLCGSDAQFLCYNPSAGDTCCVPGAGNACESLPDNFSGACAKRTNLLLQGLATHQASVLLTATAAPTVTTQPPVLRQMV